MIELNITLEQLKHDFELRFQRSLKKDELLQREKAFFELIFSFDPVTFRGGGTGLYTSVDISLEAKFPEYVEKFDYWEILMIEKAYGYFIVKGTDIKEAGKWYQENYLHPKKPSEILNKNGKSFINVVLIYYDYLQWLGKFSRENTTTTTENIEPIISLQISGTIWGQFGHYFSKESKENWMRRFNYNPQSEPPHPIIVAPSCRGEDSNRLVLIALLSSIHKLIQTYPARPKKSRIIFKDFVMHNFGIANYQTSLTRNKDKQGFEEAVKKCDNIIKSLQF